MSGNGCQLWFALPPFEVTDANRPAITAQLKAFEARVRREFNGDGVAIDSIYNLSRIIKVIGTRSIKGNNTRERPHRLSASRSAFERAEDPDLLDAIRALPVEDKPAPKTCAKGAPAAAASGVSDRILELLESSTKLNALFEGRGKPVRGADGKRLDESSSGYDFSLALSLARKGISDPAEIAAAIYHRPDGEARAKGPSYIERTVERALSRATVLRAGARADAGEDGPGTESELPSILVSDRELRDVSRDAVDALTRANDPPVVFQRGMTLARVRQVDTGLHRLETFVQASMRGRLGRVANWRKETTTRRGDVRQTAVSPPIDVVQDVLALPAWPFPSIEGVVAAPVFSSDGHLMTRTGYHSDARLWIHLDRELAIEPVSLAPSDAEVEQARSLLVDDLLGEFPFVDQASRAHAFAALLLPFVRPMAGKATPLHLIDAPSPGTGKSLLGDVICIPATGQPAQAMTEAHDEDEWRKRLTAAILEAPVFLLLDNLNRPLKSGKLAVALTTGLWQDRILGRTETVTIPVTNVWLATGNNVALSDEIARRSIWIRLDARVDQPWMRSGFRHSDLQTWARKHRGELIRAALTLGQAWVAAGKPRDTSSLGGFETWAGTMGGILSVAGVPGFLGNLKDLYARADEDTADWRAFVEHWWERHQDRPVKTQELYQLAHDTELLDAVLGDKSERSQKTRLGRALGKKRDRVVGEHRIEAGGRDYKARNVFRLRRTDSDAHSPSAGATLEMFSNRAGTSPAMSAPGNHVGTTSVTSATAPTLGEGDPNVGATSVHTSVQSNSENHVENVATTDVHRRAEGYSPYNACTHVCAEWSARARRSGSRSVTSVVEEKAPPKQYVNPTDVGTDVVISTSVQPPNVGGEMNTHTPELDDDWEVFET